jgi:hypothetical protein
VTMKNLTPLQRFFNVIFFINGSKNDNESHAQNVVNCLLAVHILKKPCNYKKSIGGVVTWKSFRFLFRPSVRLPIIFRVWRTECFQTILRNFWCMHAHATDRPTFHCFDNLPMTRRPVGESRMTATISRIPLPKISKCFFKFFLCSLLTSV